MTRVISAIPFLEPLRFDLHLPLAPAAAFRAFTEDIGRWWPLQTHSLGQDKARTCRFEPRAGGRLLEVGDDGAETAWAEVLAWDPPHLLVLSWHPGLPPERGQQVEVRFDAQGDGTRLRLEHRDWQQTESDKERREQYREGWASILEQRFDRWLRANEAAQRTLVSGDGA